MALDIDRLDLDHILPVVQPPPALAPALEPDDATLVWRLRAWELHCLPMDSADRVRDWLERLAFIRCIARSSDVSLAHEITVWQVAGGQRLLGYLRQEHHPRRKVSWVAAPWLVPLKLKPPGIRRRLFVNFDKFQAALDEGHQGRRLHYAGVNAPAEPQCPVCTRSADVLVAWPCQVLRQWLPRQLLRQFEAGVRVRLAEDEDLSSGRAQEWR